MRFYLLVALVLLASLVYATVRYVVLGPVAPDQLPLYVFNKALSLAALIILALALVTGPWLRRRGQLSETSALHPRRLGTAGFAMAALHSVISLLILNPKYFEKFFNAAGRMFWQAETSMLCGVLAMGVLVWQAAISRRQAQAADETIAVAPRKLGVLVVVLTAVHTALMGYAGWLQPNTWHGGLPPITMLAFFIAVAAIIGRMLGKVMPRRQPPERENARMSIQDDHLSRHSAGRSW